MSEGGFDVSQPVGPSNEVSVLAGLLRTKLTVPRPRPGALERAALVDHLCAVASPGRLTLVVAGAGWGKSTLLALWHRQDPRPGRFTYVSIDAGDNDLTRFWAYILAALAPIGEGLATRSTRLLNASGTTVIEDVVPALMNELTAVTEPVTLVLDDYQLIGNDEIHHSMSLLAEHLPVTLRLVIASRTTPALPTIKLRGKGQLVDINADELRFSTAETGDLLQREMHADLSAEDVGLLRDRTEGWAAGLHLAALSLRGLPDPHHLIHRFAGDDRHIGDYLFSEVLDRQPEQIRTFLRCSCILERFCPSLCDAVTGGAESADLLKRIEDAQLFLIPLDNRREWYRYHHLFADVLNNDLERAEPSLVPELHRRAADWHETHDLPVEAVRHALAGGDTQQATDLIARHAVSVFLQGHMETVLGWFETLGEDVCRADARVCVAGAIVAAAGGRVRDMERWSDFAEMAARSSELPAQLVHSVRVGVSLTRWTATYPVGDVDASLRHARQALQLATHDPAPWRLISALGWSLYRKGQFLEAQAQLAQAGALAEEHGEYPIAIGSWGVQAIIAAAEDRHHDAERFAAEAEQISQDHALSEQYQSWCYHCARGWLSFRQAEHECAEGLFQRALQLLRRGPLRLETIEVLTALAMTHQQLGRVHSAREYLTEALRILDQCPDPGYLLADPRKVSFPPPPSTCTDHPDDLTDREAEVLRLVADGLTAQEIAGRLHLSPPGADAHLWAMRREIDEGTHSAVHDELCIHRLLDPGRSLRHLELFVREWLGALLDDDTRHRCELVETLSVYLRCGGNLDAIGAQLGIHRSTLRYRLQRIREVSGLDPADVEHGLLLQLAIQAWDVLHRTS
jgi:LuxR family maltose regulon positive regulatory protein